MVNLKTEIADTPLSRGTGLMGRKHLPLDSGMLFIFNDSRPLSFWMARTYLPLQIAFLDDSGRIKQIESMVPMNTRAVSSHSKSKYALEVNDGWFDDNNIRVGAQVTMPPGMGAPAQGMVPPMGAPGMGGQQPVVKPEIQLLLSYKEIFKRADVPLFISYVTKEGTTIDMKEIRPPFHLEETEEGDMDGLLTCWDQQRGRWGSLIVENISKVYDSAGNEVVSVDQIDTMNAGDPMTDEEQVLIEGIQENTPEINPETGIELPDEELQGV